MLVNMYNEVPACECNAIERIARATFLIARTAGLG